MLTEQCNKFFANGGVYLLNTEDSYPIETTDTFLPWYTKNAIGNKQNALQSYDLGSRNERWLIGISTMSGCPIKCRFCCTSVLKKWRNLTAEEMVEQVDFVVNNNPQYDFRNSKEFKCNMTRMGEPFLNIENVKKAIEILIQKYPNIHIFVSTIGIKDSDFSFIKGNITLQLSLHSLDENRRNELIPISKKMSLNELGSIRTQSNLKTTINMTLVDEKDFNIDLLKKYFDTKYFFVKLSPINTNVVSLSNKLGGGVIKAINLI